MNNKTDTLKELETILFQSLLTEEAFWFHFTPIEDYWFQGQLELINQLSLPSSHNFHILAKEKWMTLDEYTIFVFQLQYITEKLHRWYPHYAPLGFHRNPVPPMEYINQIIQPVIREKWKEKGYLAERFSRNPDGALCATPWSRLKYFLLKRQAQNLRYTNYHQRMQKGIFQNSGCLREYLQDNPVLWGIEGEKLPCVDEVSQEIYDWFLNEDGSVLDFRQTPSEEIDFLSKKNDGDLSCLEWEFDEFDELDNLDELVDLDESEDEI